MAGKVKKEKAPKQKKEKKSKKKTNIAAAIIPTASFLAVPRTPPPQDADPEYTSGPLASGLLSSTMLGRLFDEPDFDDNNDPDTSLEDYTDPRSLRLEDRDRLPTPFDFDDGDYHYATTHDPRYSSVWYERNGDPMISEQSELAQSAPEIYAVPQKRSHKKSSKKHASDPDFSVFDQFILPDDDADVEVHEEEQMEQAEQIEKVESAAFFSAPPGPDLDSTPRQHTPQPTPRTAEFRQQNELLVKRQEELERRLMEHENRQNSLFTRLEHTADVEASPEQSMEREQLIDQQATLTDHTLQDQDELIKTLQDRVVNLETENAEHEDMNTELRKEVDAFRKYVQNKDGNAAQSHGMAAQRVSQELKDENTTLKSAIQRLNQELSQMQATYRPIDPQNKNMVGLPSKGPIPSWLINTKYLAPLFLAYDDRIREKEMVIRQYEDEMETFSHRIEEIIKENERLHVRLEQQDITGPISMTEWQQLQEQAKLVLEENQLLLEQLDLQNEKTKQMNNAHVEEISKLTKRIVLLESDKLDLERALTDVKDKCSTMNAKLQARMIDTEINIPLPEHQNAIGEVKKTINELNRSHVDELTSIKAKLESLQTDKQQLSLKVSELTSDKEEQQMEFNSLQKSYKHLHKKAQTMQHVLDELNEKELSVQHYMTSVVKVAEQTAIERDTYAQLIKDQEDERKTSIMEMVKGKNAVDKMEQKLLDYKAKANAKLVGMVNKLKEQEEHYNRQRSDHEREIKHLRLMINDRDGLVDLSKHEKKLVEDELESMWQAAVSDNRRMRDGMERTFQKLRHHKELESRWNDDDDIKALLGYTNVDSGEERKTS